MSRRGWLLLALASGALIAVGATLRARAPGASESNDGPAQRAAREIYALTLDDADGRAQALAQWKGTVLVVNFWATWCTPCVAEMPDLDRLQQEYAGKNVAIVGIGTENQAKVRQFRDRMGLRLPLLAGGYDSLALARAFGDVQGVLPYTVLLSAQGVVLHSQTGALPPGQLRGWIEGAL